MNVLQTATFRYNSGKFDGQNAASMSNPPHRNWPVDRNDSRKRAHHDAQYLAGYLDGYQQATGVRLQ